MQCHEAPNTPTAQIVEAFKGRLYNPRRDRDDHYEKWKDSLSDALLQHPKLLKILLGEDVLEDLATLIKRFKAEGLGKSEAKNAAVALIEEHQRLNTDGYMVLKGVTDLSGVYEIEDAAMIKKEFAQGVLRDGRGYMKWIEGWTTTDSLKDQKRIRVKLNSLTISLNIKVSALSSTLNSMYDTWMKIKGNSAEDPTDFIEHIAQTMPDEPDTAKIVIVRNALAKKIIKQSEMLDDARATIKWIVEYYDKLMGNPDESRRTDGGAKEPSGLGDGGAILPIGNQSPPKPPGNGKKKQKHKDNKNNCDSCLSWVCKQPNGKCIITQALESGDQFKNVMAMTSDSRGKAYIASAVEFRKKNPTMTKIRNKKFTFLKINEQGQVIRDASQDGESMTPMTSNEEQASMFGLSAEQIKQLSAVQAGEALCVLAEEKADGVVERVQVYVEDRVDDDDKTTSNECGDCEDSDCLGCQPSLPSPGNRTSEALGVATRALQESQSSLKRADIDLAKLSQEVAELKARLHDKENRPSANTPSTVSISTPVHDQAPVTQTPATSGSSKGQRVSSPAMRPVPTPAEIDAIFDGFDAEPSMDEKLEANKNAECLRAANATAHAAVNSALMSLAIIEREQSKAIEIKREQDKAIEINKDIVEVSGGTSKGTMLGYLYDMLWARNTSPRTDAASTKALTKAVTALSTLSSENSMLRAGNVLTPLRVMVMTTLACKLGPHVWPVVCQQIALLLKCARQQLISLVRSAAYSAARAIASSVVMIIKSIVVRAITTITGDSSPNGVASSARTVDQPTERAAPMATGESRRATADDIPESLMIMRETGSSNVEHIKESLMPMPKSTSIAPQVCSDVTESFNLGLFDDGAL